MDHPEAEAVALFGILVGRPAETASGRAPDPWPDEPGELLEAVLRLHHAPEALCREAADAANDVPPDEDPIAGALARLFRFMPWPLLLPRGPLVLVGPSGAGKTTISQLPTRMYDVQEGAVFVSPWRLRERPGEEGARQEGGPGPDRLELGR